MENFDYDLTELNICKNILHAIKSDCLHQPALTPTKITHPELLPSPPAFPFPDFFIIEFYVLFYAGVSETVVLNMSTLSWSVVTTVQGRAPLASEVSDLQKIIIFLVYIKVTILTYLLTNGSAKEFKIVSL